jgi:hypothetical protein
MQFSDSTRAKKADAQRIFGRALSRHVCWVSGTEAGMGDSSDLRKALSEQATRSGYRFFAESDVWVAVAKGPVIRGTWDSGWIKTLESGAGSKSFSERGILWAEFGHSQLGKVSVGVSHYMTDGRRPGDEYYAANSKLTRAIGEWGKVHGQGRRLCFFAADANISDRTDDVFRGKPFTTLADELKDWEGSGPGNASIDVIASYDRDQRVKGKYWRVLSDKEFHLNSDHLACEGGFTVAQ